MAYHFDSVLHVSLVFFDFVAGSVCSGRGRRCQNIWSWRGQEIGHYRRGRYSHSHSHRPKGRKTVCARVVPQCLILRFYDAATAVLKLYVLGLNALRSVLDTISVSRCY